MKENNEISQIDEEIDENCLKDPSFIRSLVIKKSSACYFRPWQIQNKLHKGSINWWEFSRRTCLDGFRSFIPFKR